MLEALSHNQNEDGGFGHALEPDLRSPESSALCTSIAFQTLRLVGARYTHQMVASGKRYLIDTPDMENVFWQIIPASTLSWAHAPHWNHAGGKELFERFRMNLTAELPGYLYDRQNPSAHSFC